MDYKKLVDNTELTSTKIVNDAKTNLKTRGKNSSGSLSRSISRKVVPKPFGATIEFYMEQYGPAVDMGRDGTLRKRRNLKSIFYVGGNKGRFIPPSKVKSWMGTKPVKPKQFGSTKVSIDSAAYMINRKIATQGIAPSMFFTDAYNKHVQELATKAAQAVADDIVIDLTIRLNKI